MPFRDVLVLIVLDSFSDSYFYVSMMKHVSMSSEREIVWQLNLLRW